jgi:hypothetical protein
MWRLVVDPDNNFGLTRNQSDGDADCDTDSEVSRRIR